MNKNNNNTFTTSDGSVIIEQIVSLKDVNVLAYHCDAAHQYLEIEQRITRPCCPVCGVPARIKDRPLVRYIDLPLYGMPMVLVWRKHRWECPNTGCCQKSWTSQDRRIASGRTKMTVRAAKWVTEQVGKGRTVSEVADELGCDWHTVNNAVMVYGKPC